MKLYIARSPNGLRTLYCSFYLTTLSIPFSVGLLDLPRRLPF